jgi:hypothetical protein
MAWVDVVCVMSNIEVARETPLSCSVPGVPRGQLHQRGGARGDWRQPHGLTADGCFHLTCH